MRIFEPEKHKSPQRLKLNQLRATSKRATAAFKNEQERQKAQHAQQALQKLRNLGLNTPVLAVTL